MFEDYIKGQSAEKYQRNVTGYGDYFAEYQVEFEWTWNGAVLHAFVVTICR